MSDVHLNGHRYLMSAGADTSSNTATGVQKLVALLVVVSASVLGGFIVKVLSKG